ncbi:threonine aldolase family protein [Salaquimonas pukyongi]|uniref:threonine aldolase family protein n=1 Tax=Salaquimonas pukyongi TaxID=2712698 RepID=UPI00096B9AE7|nr:low specificity L-threonine aldolase [Salaquimonas pukyongi]
MFFASDNWAGADSRINQAIADHGSGFKSGYNNGELDRQVEAQLSRIFERDVTVFFVATGTAANSIAIASVSKAGGVTFCHEDSHLISDECGGPEFFSASRLCAVSGELGKMNPDVLKTAIGRYPADFVHHGRPSAVSITQATETGTVYSVEEIRQISAIAREHALPLHMDGARFANALVSLKTTPAEMTWKAGVDLLSFGGTKNGCWCAEALICFDSRLAGELAFHHKRAGQLFSKSRFIAAQFTGYLAGDHWLDMARHANAMTGRLAGHIKKSPNARLAFAPQANESFVVLKKAQAEELRNKGAVFFEWRLPLSHQDMLQDDTEDLYRLVTSFATSPEEVDAFGEVLNG